MLVAAVSVKRSPGVTTTCLAVGARCPAGVRPVVVECDPAGADLAVGYGLPQEPGLVSLAAAARRGGDPDLLWRHTQVLPGGLEVVVGPAGPEQAGEQQARRALEILTSSPVLHTAAARADTVVLADCGRLPGRLEDDSGVRRLLHAADVTLLVVRSDPLSLVHAAERRDAVCRLAHDVRLVLVGDGFDPKEVADALRLPVAGVLPLDRRGAADLTGRAAHPGWQLNRLPLLLHAAGLAHTLLGANRRLVEPAPDPTSRALQPITQVGTR
jgi:hypothetical protein